MIVAIDPSIVSTGIAAIKNDGKTIVMLEEIRANPKQSTALRLTEIHALLNEKLLYLDAREPIKVIRIEEPYVYVRTVPKGKIGYRSGKQDVKPVSSIIKLCFAFGVIWGTCLSQFPGKVEAQIAPHGRGKFRVGLPTKDIAANILHHIYGYELQKHGKISDNCTDALFLAWDKWDRDFKGRIR